MSGRDQRERNTVAARLVPNLCNGCGRTYPEYVNGCVEDHGRPRKVVLVVPEEEP